MTIVCKDNEGVGNTAYASLIVNFKNVIKSEIDKEYHLLATGPDGTDIPYLNLKVKKTRPKKVKLSYVVKW